MKKTFLNSKNKDRTQSFPFFLSHLTHQALQNKVWVSDFFYFSISPHLLSLPLRHCSSSLSLSLYFTDFYWIMCSLSLVLFLNAFYSLYKQRSNSKNKIKLLSVCVHARREDENKMYQLISIQKLEGKIFLLWSLFFFPGIAMALVPSSFFSLFFFFGRSFFFVFVVSSLSIFFKNMPSVLFCLSYLSWSFRSFIHMTLFTFRLLVSVLVMEACSVTKHCSGESEISNACWRRHTSEHWIPITVTNELQDFLQKILMFIFDFFVFIFSFFFWQIHIMDFFCI